jgi:hypothetical protein
MAQALGAGQQPVNFNLGYETLKVGALATAAVASGVVMTSALGTLALGAATIAGSYFAISHAVETISSLNLADDVVVSAQKTEFAFRLVIWTGLIAGAVVLGYAGASIFSAATAIGSATSVFAGLVGTQSLLFAIGYTVPFGKWLLLNSNSLDNTMGLGLREWVEAVQSMPNIDVRSALRLLAGRFLGNFTDNVDIDMLQYLPENELREYFQQNILVFSNEKIQQLVEKYPNVLTYDFLFGCLSDAQIEAVLIPELEKGAASLDVLSKIDDEIAEWTENVAQWEGEYRSDLSQDEKTAIYDQVSPVLAQLTARGNGIGALVQMMRKLPKEVVAHAQAQELIAQLKSEQEHVQHLSDALLGLKPDNLKKRMIDLVEKTAVKNEEEDLEEESYMTLASLGWRLHEFKLFAPQLGLPGDHNAMAAVAQALEARGLATRGDLIKHGILNRQDDEGNAVELTRDLLEKRLNAYLNQPIADAAPVADAALQDPLPAVDDDTWRQAAVIANHVFHYASSAALIGIQAYYQLVPTVMGIAIGLSDNAEIARVQIARVWQTSPDYVEQAVDERARELWSRVLWATTSIRFGTIGAFWSGFQHADAIRYYGRPWLDRVQQLFA